VTVGLGTQHDLVAVTARLVAASSQNPGEDERRVAGVVDELCAELGLPEPRRVGEAQRPNLIIELPFSGSGPRLGLCGHLDTKPVGAGAWATDPLRLAELDGELRGRGVADMKGAVAAMLLAAHDLASDSPSRGGLTLVFCADEENGATFGAQLLADTAPPAVDAMVIGEPGGLHADWDHLHLGSRGICNFDIEVRTSQGHSSLRELFGMVSATEVAARIVVDLADRFRPPHPPDEPWTPTLNPGVVISGGINYGVLPGLARVASECRLVPGMDQAGFTNTLRDFLAERIPSGAQADLSVRNWIPAAVVDPHDPVVEAARKALADILGSVPAEGMFPATTDATWFAALGIPTLPALGPGLIRHAHAPDEALSKTALTQARAVYSALARHYWEDAP
jgi:succinyl-diaminopimelate desuccinylase